MLNREILKAKLRATKDQIDEALEDLEKNRDEEFERLQRMEKDFTKQDFPFYTLIRIQKSDYGSGRNWRFEVSDGYARISGAESSPEKAFAVASEEAVDHFKWHLERLDETKRD